MKDSIKLRGEVDIVVLDQLGNIKDQRHINNLVVNAGLDFIASRMTGTSKNVMSHMAVGTNNTAPAAGDTDLASALGSRKALQSITVTSNTIKYVAAFEAGESTGDIFEAGIFNGATGGDMLCRSVFSEVTKDANDIMGITWTITVSA